MDRQEKVRYLANICHALIADGGVDQIEQQFLEQISDDIGAGFLDKEEALRLARGPGYQVRPVGRWSQRIRNLEDMLLAAYSNGVLEPTEKKNIKEYARQLGISQEQLDLIRKESEGRCQKYLRPAARPERGTGQPVQAVGPSAGSTRSAVQSAAGPSHEHAPAFTAAATRPKQSNPLGTKAIIIGIFVCLLGMAVPIGAVCMVFGVIGYVRAQQSTSWPSVEGRITSSEVRSEQVTGSGASRTRRMRHSHSVTVYYPAITYEYTVDGRKFSSSRGTFAAWRNDASSWEHAADSRRAEAICRRYPVGKVVTAYHDPTDPEFAVLEPGVTRADYGGLLVPMWFMVGGGVVVGAYLWWLLRRHPSRAAAGDHPVGSTTAGDSLGASGRIFPDEREIEP